MKLLHTFDRAFTIVELMVVIAVIGIIASITVVGYGPWQDKSTVTQMQNDLKGVESAMKSARNFSTGYPATIPSTFTPSAGTVMQLAAADPSEYCVNVYSTKNSEIVMSYDSKKDKIVSYRCAGQLIGSPIPSGSTVPIAPRNVNLVAGFSEWKVSGGVTYNSSTNELNFSTAGTGSATSPLVKIDSSTTAKLTIDSYATLPSPNYTPNTTVYFTSKYFAADGTTPALNSSNYTSNGNAQVTPLSSWQTKSWNTPTGANVIYVQFIINSAPTSYTSDNKIRNPSIVAL